jgi:hypothetical protein
MQIKFLSTAVLIMVLVTACQGSSKADQADDKVGKVVSTEGGEYLDISVDELESMLENKDFLMVNVHIPFEGDLPNTDLSIAFDKIDQHLDQLPSDKNAPIVAEI